MKHLLIIIGLLLAGNAQAMDMPAASSGTLTLAVVLDAAKRTNPEILAARKQWEASRARIAQETTPDKPRLDIERMYAPRNGNIVSNAGEKNVAITQESDGGWEYPHAVAQQLGWKDRLSISTAR